jgi:hypothetical protein
MKNALLACALMAIAAFALLRPHNAVQRPSLEEQATFDTPGPATAPAVARENDSYAEPDVLARDGPGRPVLPCRA